MTARGAKNAADKLCMTWGMTAEQKMRVQRTNDGEKSKTKQVKQNKTNGTAPFTTLKWGFSATRDRLTG
jgi:hypothetical protein